MRSLYIPILAILLFVAGGCNRIKEKYQGTDTQTWDHSDAKQFSFHVDEAGTYALFVSVKHLEDFRYNNLWLRIEMGQEGAKPTKYLLNAMLASPEGPWLGGGWTLLGPGGNVHEGDWRSGSVGKLHERVYTLQELRSLRLSPGNYTIRLGHEMREDKIQGVYNLGIKLKRMD